MKKALILAYDFPPYVSVGGLRPYSWCKYFNKIGIYPIIVTRQWERQNSNPQKQYISASKSNEIIVNISTNATIIRAPYFPNMPNRIFIKYGNSKYRFLRLILAGYYEITQYLFLNGPKKELYNAAKSYLKENEIDLIIATGEPFVLFKYGQKLSKKFNIPWFADYRDDWIKNHSRKMNKNLFINLKLSLEAYIEKRILKNVTGITSVSRFLTEQIAHRIKCSNYQVIENGAELKYYKRTIELIRDEFVILYSGILYDLPYLNIFSEGFISFFENLEQKHKNKIKIYFVGIEFNSNQATQLVEKMKEEYPENIIIEKRKSEAVIAQYQLNASVLLNMIAGDPSKGLIGAKTYNYAVTGNPVLTIPNVNNTKNDFFDGRDIFYLATKNSEVKEYLSNKFCNFIAGKSNKTSISGDEKYLLSREYNAVKYIDFIKKSL